jgi:hypothetical protein
MGVNILIFIICSCILLSCISSGFWGWQVKTLNDLGVCDERNLLICPLNEKITDAEYQSSLLQYLEEGKLGLRHIQNSYYEDGITKIVFKYCSKDLKKMYVTHQEYIEPTQFLIHVGETKNKKGESEYFYFTHFDFIYDIAQRKEPFNSLDDFLQTVNNYETKLDASCNVTPLDKRKDVAFDCIFFDYPYDGLVTTLRKTILPKISISIKSNYKQLLQLKYIDKNMSTFEYFMYHALLSENNKESYKFLTK